VVEDVRTSRTRISSSKHAGSKDDGFVNSPVGRNSGPALKMRGRNDEKGEFSTFYDLVNPEG